MPRFLLPAFAALAAALVLPAVGQLQPQVSNIQASQRAGTKLVDINYNVAYSGGPVTIWIDVSNDGGRSFIVPANTFSVTSARTPSPATTAPSSGTPKKSSA